MDTAAINRLRRKILDGDNLACFIERETLLRDHAHATLALPPEERYLFEFTLLMDHLSTPVDPDDVFAARMLEGRWPHPEGFSRAGLTSEGHITLPMAKILSIGLAGIADEITCHAKRIDTDEARYFERQALGCVDAIRRFGERYAVAAMAAGKPEMAAALRQVPYRPAYDFYSALQSIWMMQFIMSTVCGARDFAPGQIDQYLLAFELPPEDEARAMLAMFLLKFNEITGTATDNYQVKPTPCTSSKQYLVLGPKFDDLSRLIVEAAAMVDLPQPILNFRLRDDFTLAGEAARRIGPQANFFNDNIIYGKLLDRGILAADAADYGFTACNRVDLPGRLYNIMSRIDIFDNSLAWFRQALFAAKSPAEILPQLHQIACDAMLKDTRERRTDIYSDTWCFRLESIFFESCIQSGRDIYRQGAENYRWQHRMFSGIANMADSLIAVDLLRERYSYSQILEILAADYAGYENLQREIVNAFPKFGNGDARVDRYAAAAADVLIDAFEEVGRREGFIAMPSFYSLFCHVAQGSVIGATPDGRRSGETVSENQSPTYGADRQGPTALLNSVAALPLKRTICGGLNLKFGCRPTSEQLAALLQSYFESGGIHLGVTVADRHILEEARKHPEKYRTLLVRKTGFSEFFVALSPLEQQQMIDRTEH